MRDNVTLPENKLRLAKKMWDCLGRLREHERTCDVPSCKGEILHMNGRLIMVDPDKMCKRGAFLMKRFTRLYMEVKHGE